MKFLRRNICLKIWKFNTYNTISNLELSVTEKNIR